MLDFTSALYLGMRHASQSLRPWAQLTTGRPAALASPVATRSVASKLAALIGCEQAILAPSTLHLFWDWFGMLTEEEVAIYMDDGIYPIARWGVERAAACGVPVKSFVHYEVIALQRELKQDLLGRRRPLVVTDGFCPACGKPAPLADYLESVRALGGYLILDDTQSLGIFGHSPGPGIPYGSGGGGSLRWSDIKGPEVVIISSLAKGFGVPVAVLAGSRAMIRYFKARSETQMHCSPPSLAAIHAAEHALLENETQGDELRLYLAQLVRHFRNRLMKAKFLATGGLFPVQTLASIPGLNAVRLHEHLLRQGVRAVLHHGRNGHTARISFLITALHQPQEIDRAIEVVAQAVSANAYPQPQRGCISR